MTPKSMLAPWAEQFDYHTFQKLREQQFTSLLKINHWDKHNALIESFPFDELTGLTLTNNSVVSIRGSKQLEDQYRDQTCEIVQGLLPWRKGPFNLLGVEIDAEWRSDLKWDRFVDALPPLTNKLIADIGCNNGYYMYRMLDQNPQLLLGLDPSSRCYYQFDFLSRLFPDPRVCYEPLGVEHLEIFPEFFHVALCLGVIYHRRDPYTTCRMLYDCLKKKGELFLETLVIPGEEPHALCVPDRYAKMRNVWYVPTVSCLKVWLHKAGFREIDEITTSVVTMEEQRKTPLAPYESLEDFLDPKDQTKTIEGFPAPCRTIVRARKAS